jgi:hypothetical protein
MAEPIDHDAFVAAWLERTAVGRSPHQLLELLERALNALCASAQKTLGEVTLTAIVDRVLHEAAERHPFLARLTFESSRVSHTELLEQTTLPPEASTRDGLQFVLAEFLTVLGNLTAEILTPAFHTALSKVADASQVPGEAKDK